MHRSEEGELASCADCGAEIAPAVAEGFTFGTRGALCLECAIRRGGAYDADQDRWTTEPDLDGLGEGYD